MGKAIGRNLYFEKHIRPATTLEDYILALKNSPYRMHKRMAFAMTEEYLKMQRFDTFTNIDANTDANNEEKHHEGDKGTKTNAKTAEPALP
jgi:hypothetical protein